MKHKTPALVLLALCMVLLCVAVIVGALVWGVDNGNPDAAEQPSADDPAGGAVTIPAAQEVSSGKSSSTGGEKPAAGSKTLVAEQDGRMGPAYFADAAFLGNEITSGLWLYNNDGLLPSDTSHWFCSDGLTVLAASPYAAQMPARSFGKVYIGFGIHEVNYQKETLKAAYNTVIDQVKANQPDAIIYLMSVTPVSKYCDENLGTKRSTVQSFNQMLQDIAREQEVWYLDVYPALCGEDGYLPSEVTPDGTTFNPAHYQLWFDYLQTHYVPDGTLPLPTDTPAPEEPAASD